MGVGGLGTVGNQAKPPFGMTDSTSTLSPSSSLLWTETLEDSRCSFITATQVEDSIEFTALSFSLDQPSPLQASGDMKQQMEPLSCNLSLYLSLHLLLPPPPQ